MSYITMVLRINLKRCLMAENNDTDSKGSDASGDEANAGDSQDQNQDTDKKDDEKKKDSDQPNYQQDLDTEKQRDKAKEAFSKRQQKRETDSDKDDDSQDDDKNTDGLTADDIRQIIREENQSFHDNLNQEKITAKVNEFAGDDPHKAELIRYAYDNRIQKTGDLNYDMQNATLIANRGQILNREAEIFKGQKSDMEKGRGSSHSHKQEGESAEPNLPADIQKSLQGYVWDGKKKWYTLPDGRGKYALAYRNGALVQVPIKND